jgi:methylaspartate mutase epsilon subunit
MTRATGGFGRFVREAHCAGELVVQPRMGFSAPADMRNGLIATKTARATTVGTITLDSYTRLGDQAAIRSALRRGVPLNGYPIVTFDVATTRSVLAGVRDRGFPVQVRHGSAVPMEIFAGLAALGIDSTEGGPVSYCLPYGRVPLAESVRNWARCCESFAGSGEFGVQPHLETFGGCMLGQLCPPGQLVALSVLEALFFERHGMRSLSVSYAQQTNPEQDRAAIRALRRLCAELLTDVEWHVVVYTYMGLFPRTTAGARGLLAHAVELAATTDSERLIVKTAAEAHRIPSIEENVAALEYAAEVAKRRRQHPECSTEDDSQVYAEARALLDAVLNLHPDIGRALALAFGRGYLDIPYCVHPDNAGRSRSHLDGQGRLRWSDLGALPIKRQADPVRTRSVTSTELLEMLSYMRNKFDRGGLAHDDEHVAVRKDGRPHRCVDAEVQCASPFLRSPLFSDVCYG